MKKLFNSDKQAELYDELQSNRKKIKRRAILMVIFLFGVNAFAWFIYIAKVDMNFDASVLSWDVNFFNDSVEVNDVVYDVEDIYPGYGDTSVDASNTPYSKVIEILNNGEVNTLLSYRVKSFTIMGEDAIPSDCTTDADVINALKSYYPFIITTSTNATKLASGETAKFNFELYWPYELENKYYKLNSIYEYDSSVNYYTYANGTYTLATVTEDTFNSLVNTLYIEKDDADSFFGTNCALYEAESGNSCISVGIELKVEQTT